jgi:hypothetical protein
MVPGMDQVGFATLERGGVFCHAFYKHSVPTGRGTWVEKSCLENKKLSVCFTEQEIEIKSRTQECQ